VKQYISSVFTHAIALEQEMLKETKWHIKQIKKGKQVPHAVQDDVLDNNQNQKGKGMEQRYIPLSIFTYA